MLLGILTSQFLPETGNSFVAGLVGILRDVSNVTRRVFHLEVKVQNLLMCRDLGADQRIHFFQNTIGVGRTVDGPCRQFIQLLSQMALVVVHLVDEAAMDDAINPTVGLARAARRSVTKSPSICFLMNVFSILDRTCCTSEPLDVASTIVFEVLLDFFVGKHLYLREFVK